MCCSAGVSTTNQEDNEKDNDEEDIEDGIVVIVFHCFSMLGV